MQIAHHALFPTRLVTLEFSEVQQVNAQLLGMFQENGRFRDDFDMHPDSLNLLQLRDQVPALDRLREMFLAGVREWLRAEQVKGPMAVDVVLFCNYAARGEYTLVHNHSADLVGIYYVRTGEHDRPPVFVPDPEEEYDYFAAEDGVLVLHDPRFNANLAAVRSRDFARIYPRPGLMLIFPGFLWHSVTPHLGDFRRLALSANFNLRWPGGSNAETWAVEGLG